MENIAYNGKYIKNNIYEKKVQIIAIVFLFVYFVLPQYFGLPTPGFDLTVQRMMLILVALIIMNDKKSIMDFYHLVKEESMTKYICVYLFIAFYTAGLRGHIGTFLNPFLEFVIMFELVYLIKNYLGIDRTINIVVKLLSLLCILGVIEFINGESLFSHLETIDGLYTGIFIRSGTYRIMGPANHSLGYGLILLVSFPLACYNTEKKEINIFNNVALFALVTVNVFLTGSRSTLGLYFIELGLLFFMSRSINKKKFIIIFSTIIFLLCIIVIGTYGSAFSNYVLLQITSIIDEVFGSELSLNYGADISRLQNSSDYRAFLPKVFTVGWLSPILGKGLGYRFAWRYENTSILSIDNYYIVLYIAYAYPGMISFIIFALHVLTNILQKAKENKNQLMQILFIAGTCYFINLWWVASLQTLKYVYIIFAIFIVYKQKEKGELK